MSLSLSQIKFAAQECELQQSGEMSVFRMCYAIIIALEQYGQCWIDNEYKPGNNISLSFIQNLGMVIDPIANPAGNFRTTEVTFPSGGTAAPWPYIQQLLTELLADQDKIGRVEFYERFERIHPFRDGNGRVGAILYNMDDNIYDPQLPPDLFGRHSDDDS